jgi:hypothetical protein
MLIYTLYAMKGAILMDSSSPNHNLSSIRACKRCNKLLTLRYEASSLCPDCIDKDKEDYRLVKEYIQTHANANVYEVSKETGVNMKTIMRFINDDRVQVVENKSDYHMGD